MNSDVIGITTCEVCNSRFQLRQKHAHFQGKKVRCPKCHQDFTLIVQRPSAAEQAAIENSTENEKQQRRQRRTKAEIRQEHLDRIKDGFRTLHTRLVRIRDAEKSSEEEVRRWCVDVLRDCLGFDDSVIDTEARVLNGRADICLKRNDKIFLVIECKNIRSKLPHRTLEQAIGYAAHLSADWAVTTNGQQWRLYRVIPRKGKDPSTVQMFDIAFLDEDGMSNRDAELLYMLTARAMFSGECERLFHRIACTSDRRLIDALTSDRVTRAIRLELKDAYAAESDETVALEEHHVQERVCELFLPAEL